MISACARSRSNTAPDGGTVSLVWTCFIDPMRGSMRYVRTAA